MVNNSDRNLVITIKLDCDGRKNINKMSKLS